MNEKYQPYKEMSSAPDLNTPQQAPWEERFDLQYVENVAKAGQSWKREKSITPSMIKGFIEQTLHSQLSLLLERVKEKRKLHAKHIPSVEPNRAYEMNVRIHNSALSEVESEILKLMN